MDVIWKMPHQIGDQQIIDMLIIVWRLNRELGRGDRSEEMDEDVAYLELLWAKARSRPPGLLGVVIRRYI